MSAVIHADEASFKELVEDHAGVVLVDFWGTGCPPCKLLSPIIDELAVEYEGRARIVKLDVYEQMGPAMTYHVSTIPTLIVFKDGEVKDRRRGAASKDVIRDWIESHLSLEE
ncbi:MAG: thioredoxin [Planctomycetota bacterium]|nr:thioredoxin [Planctomycetota bacterium]